MAVLSERKEERKKPWSQKQFTWRALKPYMSSHRIILQKENGKGTFIIL